MRMPPRPCGLVLTGADDEELFRLGREHADTHHPDAGITDGFIRQRVAADARGAGAGDVR